MLRSRVSLSSRDSKGKSTEAERLMESVVCLVTGCSHPTGFGIRTCRLLAARGHRPIAGLRDPVHADGVDALREFGVPTIELDVTDQDQVDEAVREILDAEGRLDALVNNAASAAIGALEDTRASTLVRILDVNLVGVHRLVQRVLPGMRQRGRGVIVNVGSIHGFAPPPILGAYSASKAGLSAYTEILAYEVGHFGVRVHLVEPGGFATGIERRVSWEPGGLDPENPYYPLQTAFWGDPDCWDPEALGDPDEVAVTIVDAIEDPSATLFLPVPQEVAVLRQRMFGLDERARRAETFTDVDW
jgi:NAD(P)-dependent dehydrogenase (short-subunit alcohol dehydrogenase family)